MSRFKNSWGKAKILLSQLLCIGAVFTSCTDDEVINQTTKALQVSVSTETPAESRAIIDGGYLPDGASIGVTLTAEDGTAYDGQAFTNLQYTAAGEGAAQTWSSATPASLSITAGKVIAYYPYYGGDDFDLKAVPVETASQTDYMYAKPVTGINMVSPAANLTMQHAMTDIRINVKKGSYTGTGEVTKITAKAPAFATSAIMDVETGVFANVSGGGAQFVQELTGTAISSGNVVHDFLVVPDAKSTSGEVSIFVIIDGKKFAVTVPYTESFQQGFAYTYNLTLDNAALTLDGVSVAKWGVKAEVDESLQFYDDQYIVEIAVPSDGYTYRHNIGGFVGTIDWGDGTVDTYAETTTFPTHNYATAGNYNVTAEGLLEDIYSGSLRIDGQYRTPSMIITKLIRIGEKMGVNDMGSAFSGHTLLAEIVPGALDGCYKVKRFSYIFSSTSITKIPVGLFDKCTEAKSFDFAFNGCKKLSSIPEGLFDNCTEVTSFIATFAKCENLTYIPKGLFDYCTEIIDCSGNSYNDGLFSECKNLQEIPAGLFDYNTKVKDLGFVFFGCKSLTSIPEGLFDKCTDVTDLSGAFSDCIGITKIPEGLFDNNTKLINCGGRGWAYGTFHNTSITAIPAGLFDKCTEVTDFYGTFNNCSKLQAIPMGLFDNCTKVTTFYGTFEGCDGLQAIPEGLFDKCTEVTTFEDSFYSCDNLFTIPNGLFDKCTKVTNFRETFGRCKSLTNIPEGLFDKNTKVTSFNGVFYGTGITVIPEGLFDYNTEVTNFQSTFSNCSSLTSIPSGLFNNNTKVTEFGWLFDKCTEVTSESPYTIINVNGQDVKVHLYERAKYPEYFTAPTSYTDCFNNCTKLTDYSAIPSTWL